VLKYVYCNHALALLLVCDTLLLHSHVFIHFHLTSHLGTLDERHEGRDGGPIWMMKGRDGGPIWMMKFCDLKCHQDGAS